MIRVLSDPDPRSSPGPPLVVALHRVFGRTVRWAQNILPPSAEKRNESHPENPGRVREVRDVRVDLGAIEGGRTIQVTMFLKELFCQYGWSTTRWQI